jgi:hypothetical protein
MKNVTLKVLSITAMTLFLANCAPSSNSGDQEESMLSEKQAQDLAGYKTASDDSGKEPGTPPEPVKPGKIVPKEINPTEPKNDNDIYEKCLAQAKKKYPGVAEALDSCSQLASKAYWAEVAKIVGKDLKNYKSNASKADLDKLYAAESTATGVLNETLKSCYAKNNITLELIAKFGKAITSCTGF